MIKAFYRIHPMVTVLFFGLPFSCAAVKTVSIFEKSVTHQRGVDLKVTGIQYIGAASSFTELGAKKKLAMRFVELLTGLKPDRIERPLGIWAENNVIAVVEPVKKRVAVVDLREKRGRAVGGFYYPVDVAVVWNRVFVSDADAGQVFVFDMDLKLLDTVGLGFKRPVGLCGSEGAGHLFVVDTWAHTVYGYNRMLKRVLEIGGRGDAPGQFNFPTFCDVDSRGLLYVVDSMNFRVQIFNAYDGAVVGTFGCHAMVSGCMAQPKGIGVDSRGHIYLADAIFDAVQVFDRDGTLLAVIGRRGRAPAQFWSPADVDVDEKDRVFISDMFNDRIQVFQYYPEALT